MKQRAKKVGKLLRGLGIGGSIYTGGTAVYPDGSQL
jgi:hypothetical protein